MIKVDMAGLSREELHAMVSERCSRFGSVADISIVMDSSRYRFALAVVEMSTLEETLALLRSVGDSIVDNMVVVSIEPVTAPGVGRA